MYSTTSEDGQPHLSFNNHTFTGNEIRSQKSELGSLVTVILKSVADGDTLTLILLVPDVNLGRTTEQPIKTLAIMTTNRNTIAGPPVGARQIYEVLNLQGTAKKEPMIHHEDTVHAQGMIQPRGITTYMYGTHIYVDLSGHTLYALQSSVVNLSAYVGKHIVEVSGSLVPGYPIDGGPPFLEVNKVQEK